MDSVRYDKLILPFRMGFDSYLPQIRDGRPKEARIRLAVAINPGVVLRHIRDGEKFSASPFESVTSKAVRLFGVLYVFFFVDIDSVWVFLDVCRS